jgi:hypothetical protein
MCNVKITNVTQAMIWATGTISKSFSKYLSNITGKDKAKEMQKTTTLGTTHTLRNVVT